MCISKEMNNEQSVKNAISLDKNSVPSSQLINCLMDEDRHSQNGE